ncbi:MAG: ABC transporter substrate-binding protein [Chloroflexi bacterium]|nr:ABC transporter substrate-binding protein [Chloroflexota bacterium]
MYRHIPRGLVILAVMVLLLGSLFAAQAQGGGTLRVGMVAPQVLDPALGSNDPEVLLNRAQYDYLVDVLPDKSLAPNLATDWTISDDGLTYTFTLADGVTFTDGAPFTAADVVYTFNRLCALNSPALALLNGGYFAVSAPDDRTAVFTLTTEPCFPTEDPVLMTEAFPNADFLYGVADRFALIVRDASLAPDAPGSDGDVNSTGPFVGTGPFVLTDYREGERATLTRNENYWKAGQPALDGLELIFINDPITQVDALRSGQVDFIFKISPEQVAVLEGESGITVLQQATNQHPVVRLRVDQGPGQDERVRRAFKLATDREQLNELVLEGRGIIGNNNPIGPGFGTFYSEDTEEPGYDPAAACALLVEAGYPDGLTMTLQTINVLGYDQLATVLQQQWAEGCINVDIQVNEEGFYYSDDNPNNWLQAELGITGWGDRPVPQGYLTQAYITGGIYNETHWSDPELDELVAQAGITTDQAARADIYHQIADIFAARGPIIVPWFAPIFGAVRDNVQGLTMAPFPGLTDLRTVSVSGG